MGQTNIADGGFETRSGPDPIFVRRVFLVFLALALLSVVISLAGRHYGRQIALAGHTESTHRHEIVLVNNVLSVPANAIRFEQDRRDGVAHRLDLYLSWPEMEGYTAARRNAFNHGEERDRIIFLGFEPQLMSRDMSDRYALIYESLIEPVAIGTEGDVAIHAFRDKSGYANEVLAIAPRDGRSPFVARCLDGDVGRSSLAPCERDLLAGDGLSLTYRFPRHLLKDWRSLDEAVSQVAASYLATAP